MLKAEELGQIFTPPSIVEVMLSLKHRNGRVLEPSCGDGAFSKYFNECVAVEFDKKVAARGALVMDFFDYPVTEKFETVIGNPPYVKCKAIHCETAAKLDFEMFDGRTNLYLFFIHKAIQHLSAGGELIFIVPRDFIKLTSARVLNKWLAAHGTITHWIEMGDVNLFTGACPNCAIFRYELGNFSGKTAYRTWEATDWDIRDFVEREGQILFTKRVLDLSLGSIFSVKVGAVSGADHIFEHPEGNADFVCSKTIDTGATRRMIYNRRHPALEPYRTCLLERRVRVFDDSNWWMWGRSYHDVLGPRIYVNGKTRRTKPFFTHPCTAYDGSVLALFPKSDALDISRAVFLLNSTVPWDELGFVVGGRFVFSQRSLENTSLPESFYRLGSE